MINVHPVESVRGCPERPKSASDATLVVGTMTIRARKGHNASLFQTIGGNAGSAGIWHAEGHNELVSGALPGAARDEFRLFRWVSP